MAPPENVSLRARRGAVAIMTAILLVVVIATIALAIDLGYILLTKTELHAAVDSAALAGGTELLAGLGIEKTKTPAEVDTAARAAAVAYAANNYAGDETAVYADGARDVRLGTAVFDTATGTWVKTWDVGPYNMVRAITRRDQDGSSNGDRPLPLLFAPILGHATAKPIVHAVAVLMPADGFRVPPGSDETANVLPFAFRKTVWDRRKLAQDYQDVHPGSPLADNPYIYGQQTDNQGNPVFDNQGNPVLVQDVFDQYGYVESDGNYSITNGADGILEVDLYPEDPGQSGNTAGNSGTIDFGATNNATNDIARQIRDGLNADDLSYFDDSQLVFSEESPLDVEGDTGISGGPIDSAFNDILGEPRAIALFTQVQDPGNNAIYTLVEFAGVRVMYANLTGSQKHIYIQPAKYIDGSGIPDLDEPPGDDTSIFSPLILIE